MRFCEKCRAQIEDKAKFCNECGARVTKKDSDDRFNSKAYERESIRSNDRANPKNEYRESSRANYDERHSSFVPPSHPRVGDNGEPPPMNMVLPIILSVVCIVVFPLAGIISLVLLFLAKKSPDPHKAHSYMRMSRTVAIFGATYGLATNLTLFYSLIENFLML